MRKVFWELRSRQCKMLLHSSFTVNIENLPCMFAQIIGSPHRYVIWACNIRDVFARQMLQERLRLVLRVKPLFRHRLISILANSAKYRRRGSSISRGSKGSCSIIINNNNNVRSRLPRLIRSSLLLSVFVEDARHLRFQVFNTPVRSSATDATCSTKEWGFKEELKIY